MGEGVRKKLDAENLVSVAKKNNIEELDLLDYEISIYGETDLLKALCKYQVSLGCIVKGVSFFDRSQEQIQEEIQAGLELVKRMNTTMLMIVPGRYDEDEKNQLMRMNPEEMRRKSVEGFRIAVEMAKSYEIKVVFENTPHSMKPLASVNDCEYIFQQVSGLGLVFDTGNFRVADSTCDELQAYERLKKYIVRYHLKDVVVGDFETGEKCVDEKMIRPVVTGSGVIPIKELIHKMKKDGFNGTLVVEYTAPKPLEGEEHIPMVGVYTEYIRACMEGEPIRTKYGHIDGLSKDVSRLFFGTAIMPMAMGKNVEYLLDTAMANGINAFECARGYGFAEKSLGQWIKNRNNRERVVILTKCGNVEGNGIVSVNRDVIEKELQESLEALQTNYIDIYLLHRDDPNTSVEEIMDTLNAAKRAGKIVTFGVSNWTQERIQEANAYAVAHQLEGFAISSPNYGLAEQIRDPWGGNCVTITGDANEATRDWYRENQMPVLAYSSLARGLLAGKIKSTQEEQASEILDQFCVKGYVCHDNFLRLARCEELALKKGKTVSQIAMGWLDTQGMNLYAAFSTTKVNRIKENLDALYVDLTDQESRYLNLQW